MTNTRYDTMRIGPFIPGESFFKNKKDRAISIVPKVTKLKILFVLPISQGLILLPEQLYMFKKREKLATHKRLVSDFPKDVIVAIEEEKI